ncbi:hypothetical protein GGTG_09969 [Gaeumannomyces tritici R3-111a-1]|uniref:SET domain-containing protein n=1 Tax=Gaeumannomyces tritici (strain R3-111a-1) TaxID=644352 RepID=J3P8Y4_GAET3|nr:hypothetical protein GGTG_09969 [Gaeumannomyces tritici R3-111a-1]EJT73119.1 hypothetical protein GGTG_09969 [Gaeumannomyces tritici R3-111a-1]
MEGREKLLDWAKREGASLHGVYPTETPYRGAGMAAGRHLKEGEDILYVPTGLVRSLHTVPEHVSRKLPSDTSIHALLAADLTVNGMTELALWRDCLPTLADFSTGMPFMWHKKLQELLPKPARELLENQLGNFHRDWARVTKAFPDLQQEDYLHNWLAVSTRSFYYWTPQMELYPPADRLALVPIADLFNHADTGCGASFTPDGFVVSTDRKYHVGQEIYISYGTHTNDLLLAEYGFVPMANRWDKTCLDDVILPRLSPDQKKLLRDNKLLGPFLLDTATLGCRKTQAAIRLLCPCSRPQWEDFLDEEGCGEHCREAMNALLRSLLTEYMATARKTVREVAELEVGQSAQRELLGQRWRQIEVTVSQAIKRLQGRDR